jgi:transposase
MNANPNRAVQVYCVDLAKRKFQVHGYTDAGACVYRRTLSREAFEKLFTQLSGTGVLVVMEACASAHHFGRQFLARDLKVKLVPPQFVAKLRHGNKTDGNDADAIYAVHRDPRVRPVPVKSVQQQDLCAYHRVRELLVKQRTQLINQARGLLAERGLVAARGHEGFAELLRAVAGHTHSEVTEPLGDLMRLIAAQIQGIEAQIDVVERRLQEALKSSELARRLDRVTGVGCITATAVVGTFGERVERFADARQFAASLGVTPRENSSGETRRLGGITKRGDPYLRKLLVQCAQSIVNACQRRDDAICQFARRLLDRRPRNTVVIAVANRLARIIHAMIKHGTEYQPAHASN